MNWLEITVAVDAEAAEAVSEVLSRYAPNAVAIEQRARDLSTDSGRGVEAGPDWSPDGPLEPTALVRAYLPVDSEVEAKRRQIAEGLWHLRQIVPMPEPAFREIEPGDWENAWKDHYHVLRVGPRFVIKPSWREHAPQPGDVVIELDPGMAFGTGLHPTTQMCLQAIERHMPASVRAIDLGTGSGILAIAAARLGAASTLALDVDPVAVEAARENARRNQVDHIVRVEAGSLAAAQAQPAFDFALVNILAKTIVQLCEAGLAEIVRPAGVIVLAGLIESQEGEVREALARAGLTVFDRVQAEDWIGLVCRRGEDITRSAERPGRRGSGT